MGREELTEEILQFARDGIYRQKIQFKNELDDKLITKTEFNILTKPLNIIFDEIKERLEEMKK